MSSEARPIDPSRFAAALESLELSTLYEKVSEIRNQQAHLKSSNEQLLPFARDGDRDCDDAIKENLEVLARMNVRLDLLKSEIGRRGMRWIEEPIAANRPEVNGTSEHGSEQRSVEIASTRPSGSLTDDVLARRLAERLNDDDDNDGVHL